MSNRWERVLITGSSGFIGHHLVKFLKAKGFWIRGVDIKNPEFEETHADDIRLLDLRLFDNCMQALSDIDQVYQLAADMGGIGYLTKYYAAVVRNNALINLHMLEAARKSKIKKYLFTSSACVYPRYLQNKSDILPLKEEDIYPADAEPGYGWEKLFSELACQYYLRDYNMKTYSVRLHNIFGPLSTYEGGKEKSPAAICRKIALAKEGDEIEVWGEGKQARSYCYIDDCIEGIYRLMQSDYCKPINIGQDRLVTIDELVDMIAKVAGKRITKRYDLSKPQGVRSRNANISLAEKVLGWKPRISLEEGLEKIYKWIYGQLKKAGRVS